jgi:hypothetical protein
MRYDYDWLMMVMGKLMRQYDRGLIHRFEFDQEMEHAMIKYWLDPA